MKAVNEVQADILEEFGKFVASEKLSIIEHK
jgi:hypothetical protein